MQAQLTQIGAVPWSHSYIANRIKEFVEIYKDRPIKDNAGGMKSPHMFAVWFIAKELNPELIVESGIWKGQSTWLLEVACPQARIISIDLDLNRREYISEKAEYSNKDFTAQDWSSIPQNNLVFFDDHQNALERMKQCAWYGFRNIIFEDNYPKGYGDCYSLKKVWGGHGHGNPLADQKSNPLSNPIIRKILQKLGMLPSGILQYSSGSVAPNLHDAAILRKWIDLYYEFPPIFKRDKTRWGDAWSETNYPTPEPLLDDTQKDAFRDLYEEAGSYTWICYARLAK